MRTSHGTSTGAMTGTGGVAQEPSRAAAVMAPEGVAVLTLAGAVDVHTVAGAAQAAARVARESPRAVVVDLSTVQMCADGLVVLVVIRRRLARRGLPVVVAGGGDEVTSLLAAARLTSLFRTFPSVDDAVRALSAA